MLAAASDAVILGFNVRPVGDARQVAEREGVEIRTYSVIYRAIEELRAAMEGMLEPEEVEDRRHGRGPPDLPRLADRHDRRLATSPRARSRAAPRSAWCATAPSSTTATIDSPAALQRGRARGRRRLRVRHRARELPGRQGGRRARGLRDAAGRARARVSDGVAGAVRRSADDPPALPRRREPEGQAQGAASLKAQLHGASARRGRGRPPGPVAARDAGGRAGRRRRSAQLERGGRRASSASLEARFPRGRARRARRWCPSTSVRGLG